MSWLFGMGGQNPPPADFSKFVPPPEPNDQSKDKNDGGPYRASFDSAAFERAAKAAKELEQSKFARDALELTMAQERRQEIEMQSKIKEYELAVEQTKQQQISTQGDEKRKTMVEETKQHQQRAQYQDQLARRRHDDQLTTQARAQEEQARRAEESVARQEKMRKATMEYEAELRHKNELSNREAEHQNKMSQIQAELMGRAKVDRENQDINLEKIRLQSQETRKTTMESIKTVGSVLGNGFSYFLGDKKQIISFATVVTVVAAGIYGSKYSIGVVAHYVRQRLGKPPLVRETSRLTSTQIFKHPIKTVKSFFETPKDPLTGIVFKPSLEERLRDISISTKHTKLNQGFYRNIMFYGPPGTGKTMFAKALAQHSGMDYAVMSGGDVAPMGRDGVTAMHKVFDWSNRSRKGVLLFVDEADAFLRKRNTEQISEDLRATLNAFLYRTGQQSKKIMLVVASNLPEQFDFAINDRIDEMVEFDLPTLTERERLVRLYFDLFVLQPVAEQKSRLKLGDFDYGTKCSEIARRCDGLSGREISKLGVAWQASGYAASDGVVTEKIIDDRVMDMINSHKKKVLWQKDQQDASYKSFEEGQGPTTSGSPAQS